MARNSKKKGFQFSGFGLSGQKPKKNKNKPKRGGPMTTFLSRLSQRWPRRIFVSLLLGLILGPWAKPAFAQNVVLQEQAGSVLTVENSSTQDGAVSGVIRNKSPNTVRDVQLFIRYTFLWKNEFHPGKESPSEAFYPTLSGDIAPGGTMPFKFTPSPPLPKRSDGKFEEPSVSIAGFTQVIQQKR